MGLDTTHDAWHGAYSRFSQWRNALAEAAGYELAQLSDGFVIPLLDWEALPDATLWGEWDETPADPLLVLLAHADNGGAIYLAQAGPLADRLDALLPLVPEWRWETQRFIDGLRSAIAAREPVVFQ